MLGSAGTSTPRVVLISRPTEYESLLQRHGTREQARFFLKQRGRSIDEVDARHAAQHESLTGISSAIPVEWRRARVLRADLDRFLFEPVDIVVTVGPSGLVANVAKYLTGQPVIGVSPDPVRDGAVLAPHRPTDAVALIRAAAKDAVTFEERTMVAASLDDGQRVLALNEVFIGHESHQSARYLITLGGSNSQSGGDGASGEHQSSSGIIVTTGTGATGWGRSISLERQTSLALPQPTDQRLAFFVREAWPSPSFGTSVTEGLVEAGQSLHVVSELDEGGVVFGDGIETDRLKFAWGMRVTVAVAQERLRLVREAR